MELTELKKQALMNYLQENGYLEVTIDDITEGCNESNFKVYNKEYNVFNEEEREKEVTNYIKDSAWAFNADFIIMNSRIEWNGNPEFKKIEKTLKEMQEKLCESANPLILALIEDLDLFVKSAVDADGYGHFLSSYDGEEQESFVNISGEIESIVNSKGKIISSEARKEWFYIYRQN
jgi:formylmethanofuran dehydrogenase subunit D